MKKHLIPAIGILFFAGFVVYATLQTNSRVSRVVELNTANTASVIETVAELNTPTVFTAPTDSIATREDVVKTAVPDPVVVLENKNTENQFGAVSTSENNKETERKDERKKFTDNIHYENEDDRDGEGEQDDD